MASDASSGDPVTETLTSGSSDPGTLGSKFRVRATSTSNGTSDASGDGDNMELRVLECWLEGTTTTTYSQTLTVTHSSTAVMGSKAVGRALATVTAAAAASLTRARTLLRVVSGAASLVGGASRSVGVVRSVASGAAAALLRWMPRLITSSLAMGSTGRRTVGKRPGTSCATSASASRGVGIRRTVGSAATAAMSKNRAILLAVAAATSGAVSRAAVRILSAALGVTSSVRRGFGLIRGSAAWTNPLMLRRLPYRLTATATMTAAQANGRAFVRSLTAVAVTANGILRRSYGKVAAAVCAGSGVLARGFGIVRAANGFLNPSATLQHQRLLLVVVSLLRTATNCPGRILSATVLLQASDGILLGKIIQAFSPTVVSLGRACRLTIALVLFPGATLLRTLGARLLAVQGLSRSLGRALQGQRTLSVPLALLGGQAKAILRELAALTLVQGVLWPQKLFIRTLSTWGNLTSRQSLRAGKVLGATLGHVESLAGALRAARVVSALQGAAAAASRRVQKGLGTLQVPFPGLTQQATLRRALSAFQGASAGVLKMVSRRLSASLNATAGAARFPAKVLLAAVGLGAALGRSFPVRLAAQVAWATALWPAKVVNRALATSSTALASLAAARGKTLTVLVSVGVSWRRAIAFPLVTCLSAIETIGKMVLLSRAVSMLLSPAMSRAAAFVRILSASTTLLRSLAAGRLRVLVLAAGLLGTASGRRGIAKALLGSATVSPRLTRAWGMRLVAGLGLAAGLAASRAIRNVVDLARRILAPARRSPWRP